jgi:hypothetical protein
MLSEDTLRRLEAKQEELALLFLEQSNSDDWKDLTTSTRRGDVYWFKKNANQTLGMITRIQALLNMHLRPNQVLTLGAAPDGDTVAADEERMLEQAERDAVAMIERVRTKKR